MFSVHTILFMLSSSDQPLLFFNNFTVHSNPDKFEKETLDRPEINGRACAHNGLKRNCDRDRVAIGCLSSEEKCFQIYPD